MTEETILSRATPSLRKKIEYSINLVRKAEKIAVAYDAENGFFLAFSGGKDSQALYHIAELAGVRYKAHFSPTSVDPPQVIRFIHNHYPDVEFMPIKRNIYDLAVDKTILPSMRIRWCCAEFKENAGAGKVTLIGVRHAESARRAKRNEVEINNRKFSGNFEEFEEYRKITPPRKRGRKSKAQTPSVANPNAVKSESITGCISGKDSLLISPIIHWTEKDVWEFLNNVVRVPHCELYDQGYHRIGCIMCPMSQHKQKIKEMQDFPHVKRKWIDAIKRIRQGGVSQSIATRHNDGGWIQHPNKEHWIQLHQTTPPYWKSRVNKGVWALQDPRHFGDKGQLRVFTKLFL